MKSLEAIALEYGRHTTPRVTAKGQNELARRILDEAQKTTAAQMKMFLTRFGMNSRMVVCGDPHQVDIPGGERMSGLNDAVQRLEGVDGIQTIRFNSSDVVRHPLVGKIVDAYEGGHD
jgi:phosphate starvation-inducible PhoH-like protein